MRQKRAQKREENMPNITPISDLRNYSVVLHDVAVGAPVFLTKNGRGRYAILDIQDFEKTQATIRLMNELAKGRSENLSLTGLVLTVYHSLVHYFLCTL